MLSALKKLASGGEGRCPAPAPMSSSLQKKFSRGVNYNMKILIKGDRNVGKSCLLQRLQGGAFIEDYVPTEQIQAAAIHWTYKNTDHIVKVEVWEVVDKGRTKKKTPAGLKIENQSTPAEDIYEAPVLDASFLDVYKNTHGVILMLDITKPWTFDYVVKELSQVPADIPVVILGNHCDMQHHRQVHQHHIDQALGEARATRNAPIRYAESSMRNGFGLRMLHKFLNVPFLRLQRSTLLEQLQRNQNDALEVEEDLNIFQNSEDSNYNIFLEKLTSKRRQSAEPSRPTTDRSPSIVLGGGKPIIPPNVNPLLGTSLNPLGIKAQHNNEIAAQSFPVTPPALSKPKYEVNLEVTPKVLERSTATNSAQSTPGKVDGSAGDLDDFYAGTLDNSFLDDFTPIATNEDAAPESSDSDGEPFNPMVMNYDDLEDLPNIPEPKLDRNKMKKNDKSYGDSSFTVSSTKDAKYKYKGDLSLQSDPQDNSFSLPTNVKDSSFTISSTHNENSLSDRLSDVRFDRIDEDSGSEILGAGIEYVNPDFKYWLTDTSARRSPEGGEDPSSVTDASHTASIKESKKHKKSKKSKDKDAADKSERKEKKHKHKKSKSKEISHPQSSLLTPDVAIYDAEDYDSL